MPRLASEGVVAPTPSSPASARHWRSFSATRASRRPTRGVPAEEYLNHVWAAVSKKPSRPSSATRPPPGLEPDARLTRCGSGPWRRPSASPQRNAESAKEDGNRRENLLGVLGSSAVNGFTLELTPPARSPRAGHPPERSDSIVGSRATKARLLPVASDQHLFGKDQASGGSIPLPRQEEGEAAVPI